MSKQRARAWVAGSSVITAAGLAAALSPPSAWAHHDFELTNFVCVEGHADPTGNGIINLADVLCTANVALYELASAPGSTLTPAPPPCLAQGSSADANCDGAVDVYDVQLTIVRALGLSYPHLLDADQDKCPDSCQTVEVCADDPCAGSVCGVVTCGGVTTECGPGCGPGLACTKGQCYLPGSCFGACGAKSSLSCFCDEACHLAGDCCADVCSMCPSFFPASCTAGGVCGDGICAPAAGETCETCPQDCACSPGLVCSGQSCVAPGLCAGACGGASPKADCWCDAGCADYGDCCEDACTYCGDTVGATCTSGPGGGSCAGYCGGPAPAGCWCDANCKAMADCCDDVCDLCLAVVPSCQ